MLENYCLQHFSCIVLIHSVTSSLTMDDKAGKQLCTSAPLTTIHVSTQATQARLNHRLM